MVERDFSVLMDQRMDMVVGVGSVVANSSFRAIVRGVHRSGLVGFD